MPPFLRKLEGALANPVLNFLGLRRNSIVILKNNQFRSRLLFSSDFPLDNAIRNRITLLIGLQLFGEVLERLNRPVSKTGVGVTPPWVRIPPSPLSFLLFSIDYNEIGECVRPTKFIGWIWTAPACAALAIEWAFALMRHLLSRLCGLSACGGKRWLHSYSIRKGQGDIRHRFLRLMVSRTSRIDRGGSRPQTGRPFRQRGRRSLGLNVCYWRSPVRIPN